MDMTSECATRVPSRRAPTYRRSLPGPVVRGCGVAFLPSRASAPHVSLAATPVLRRFRGGWGGTTSAGGWLHESQIHVRNGCAGDDLGMRVELSSPQRRVG